jgi:hypothetical protein
MPLTHTEDGFISQIDAGGDVSIASLHIVLARSIAAKSPHVLVDLRDSRIDKSGLAMDLFVQFLWEQLLPALDASGGRSVWLIDQSASHPIFAEIGRIAEEVDVLHVATDRNTAVALFSTHQPTSSAFSDTEEILLTELAVA